MSIKLLGVLVLTGFIMSCASEHESFVWPSANADPLVFSPLTGSEESIMRNSSIGNEPSYLSVVGDPVGPEIDRIYNSGYMHYVGGDYEKAQILANYTLFHAAKTGTALTLVQLNQIFVLRAYALADSDRIEQAMAIHYYWLDVLKNEGDWERKIPDGLEVIKEIDQAVRTQKTAVCYQEIAIGQTILGDFEGAYENVVRAVELFKESGDFDGIEYTLAVFIINSSSFGAWEYAIRFFGEYELYAGKGAKAGASQNFRVLISVVGAFLGLGDLQNAFEVADGMVFLADSMGYSDEGVVLARQLRDQLAVELGIGSGEPETLIEAIQLSDAEQVRRFLQEGANPNELDDEGSSPLMVAAKSTDDAAIIQILIDAGADPNIRGFNGITPLAMAGGFTNNFEGVRALLKAGANPNASSDAGWTTLLVIARTGKNTEMARLLLSAGADPNAVTNSGLTALYLARNAGNREMAQLLIDAGAR